MEGQGCLGKGATETWGALRGSTREFVGGPVPKSRLATQVFEAACGP